ncbi:ABC transporter permease [Chondrinema litorale]|uniref:ABC transporter permease n=1 Tax=Chondrinema litorale TaxID=2994555 RepID=UPI0025443D55|nr:ABC transporter permease [Chondrinema litorale]UZR95348.1 ABC transporter permease [Chondrinema litorale]
MFKNYFKISIRNIKKKKLFTLINLSGLGLAIACNILIYIFVKDELSFDQFHQLKDRIVRINRITYNPDGSFKSSDAFLPMPLGPSIEKDLPEVEKAIRFLSYNQYFVKIGEDVFSNEVLFTEPEFLNTFSFKVLKGNKNTALDELNSILITEDVASKYFKETNPIGQEIEVKLGDNFETFIISAILEDSPSNSSISFNMILPLVKAKSAFDWVKESEDMWNRSAFPTYLLLKEGVSVDQLQQKLLSFRHNYYPEELGELKKEKNWQKGDPVEVNYYAQPITDIHLNTQLQSGMSTPSNPVYSYILIAIGLSLLVLACINFTTLTIGQATRRIREIGMRKTVGAQRLQLIFQFWIESFLMTVLATIIGVFLAYITLPEFNFISQKNLEFSSLINLPSITVLVLFLITTGIVAGAYPAIMFSGFKPLYALKGKVKLGGTNLFTRSLVVLQFVISALLVSVTLLMSKQIQYMKTKDLGFSKEQILVINSNSLDGYNLIEKLRVETANIPSILNIAGSATSFTMGSMRRGFEYDGENKQVHYFEVSANYIETMDMKLLEGRNFNPLLASDSTNSILVNQALVKDFNFDNPIGVKLEGFARGDNPAPVIIGVLKDYHFTSLASAIEPLAITIGSRFGYRYLLVKIAPGTIKQSISALENIWNKISPDLPFTYYFLDNQMKNQYENDERWEKIVLYASAITIFIACLGLFGLTSITTAGRVKEIGIRKVLGASITRIIWLISSEFTLLVSLAILIATPVTWFLCKEWLQNFAYKIAISPSLFLLTGLFILSLSILTSAFYTIKSALSNPVKALRSE